ncbi:hypothetical protein D3C76_1741850 [compost metagenome]
MLVARARSLCGNQVATTRLLVGKHGASVMPTRKRKPSSDKKPWAKPCKPVNNDHNVSASQ